MGTLSRSSPAPATSARSGEAPRATLLALRFVALTHALAVAAQPVFAGIFLNGEVDAIDLHRTNGQQVVFYVAIAMVVAAVLYWRPGGGRGWPALAALGLLAAEVLQIVLGYERQLAIHIPLGATIVTLSVLFTVWVMGAAARRPRHLLVGHGR